LGPTLGHIAIPYLAMAAAGPFRYQIADQDLVQDPSPQDQDQHHPYPWLAASLVVVAVLAAHRPYQLVVADQRHLAQLANCCLHRPF